MQKNKKGGKRKVYRKGFKWGILFLKVIVFFALLGFFVLVGLFAYYAKDLPNPDKINKRVVAQSTKIYDRTGKHLLYEIYGDEKRTVIPLSEIPYSIRAATVALEDRSFYHHWGVDFQGILRAILKSGGRQGGSTITQQFVKNSLLTSERSVKRKIKEIILSLEIERKFSKDEILRMYLNEIPYGSSAFGIEAAAQTFFGKHAKDLTLAQSALLACLPNKPGRYSPTGSHTDMLLRRWRYALDSMVEINAITKEEAERAKKEDILAQIKPRRTGLNAPHFVFHVIEQLEEEFDKEELEKGGLKIYTTLDWDLQKMAEKAVKEGVEKNGTKYGFSNAALVAINPKTGEVLAMVGSKDYWSDDIDGKFNVALSMRQPGSSFKPYAYAEAFRKGYTPETIVFDVKTNFGRDGSGKYYRPQNYTGKFQGPVKLKEALATSLNIPAVKVLYLAGINDVVKLAKNMGVKTLKENSKKYGLALVLGGVEVRLLDHVGAFGVFANKGIKVERRIFSKIKNAQGELIKDFSINKNEKRVLDRNVALQITDILSDNKLRTPAFGENNPLVVPGYEVAAKTGTTNNYRDGWLLGASPTLAAGVWAGNNDNHPMHPGAAGVYVAAPIWHNFMKEALTKFPKEDFDKAEKIETGKDILDGKIEFKMEKIRVCEYRSGKYCLANNYCPEDEVKKKKFFNGHTILYYVDREDPTGDPPDDPTDDPQFEKWEEAVLEWGKKHMGGKKKREMPTRECRASDF